MTSEKKMTSRCLEHYVLNMNLSGILILSSQWREESSGDQNEFFTEEIVCLKDGNPHRMVIETKIFCGWRMGEPPSATVISEQAISEEEYNQIVNERGGIEDTPVYRATMEEIYRLRDRLKEMIPNCPDCGARMQERKGPYGEFLGCSRYPKCKGTQKLTKEWKRKEDEIWARIKELEERLKG
jgi:hypothetical protein